MPAALAGGDDDLAGRLEDDGCLGRAAAERLEGRRGALLGLDELRGAALALGLALLLERARALRSAHPSRLVRAPTASRSSSSLSALATRAAATLRLFVELLEQARARVLVDPRDDVLREVEHALQVARGDVEQQAEAARRALDEPDVR